MKPSPSMNEIATIATRIRTSVRQKVEASFAGLSPSSRPARIAAMKHPVPVAESQLKSKRAASGVGLVTTGAARVMALWRSGTDHVTVVDRLIAPFTAGSPQSSTMSDRIGEGIHAPADSAGGPGRD